MCFAFSGFEITSFVGQEVHNPRRVIPIGVLIGGIVTTVIYIVGSASVLIAVPPSSLKELSGITDAVQLVGSRVGLGGLGVLTGALLALNALAGTPSKRRIAFSMNSNGSSFAVTSCSAAMKSRCDARAR